VDRVVTVEGIPHQAFFGWTVDGGNRAVSKLLGTDRRIYLYQEFQGEAPPTSSKMKGILRRWRDLPSDPWDQVKRDMAKRFNWHIPDDAYVLMEAKSPHGCQ
jgi:hypothetical protein